MSKIPNHEVISDPAPLKENEEEMSAGGRCISLMIAFAIVSEVLGGTAALAQMERCEFERFLQRFAENGWRALIP